MSEKRDIDWVAVRNDYEGGMSLRSLASRYRVSKSVIGQRKRDENWTPAEHNYSDERTHSGNAETKTRDVNAAVRVQQAIKIYLEERPTWDEIASRTGFASRGAAHNAVQRELSRCITHDIAALRAEELYMITELETRCYREAMDKSNDAWTWAVDRFEKLSKRKADLMGLDRAKDEAAGNVVVVREIPNAYLGIQEIKT